MPLDGLRHMDDPGLPLAEREQRAADRAEIRWRTAAAQRPEWKYIEAAIGWLIIAGLVLAALVVLP